MYGKMAARTLYPGLPQSCSYTRAPIDAILMDIAFKYQYITIIVLAHHLGRLLQCREVRKKSAKAARPSLEYLVQGCLNHRILWVPFFLYGDDSVMASYLLTSSFSFFHRQVVSSRRAPTLRGITAPGHHQAQLEPFQGVLSPWCRSRPRTR